MRLRTVIKTATLPLAMMLLAGCTLSPRGTATEKEALDEAGQAYQLSVEVRALPELPDRPTWREILRRTLLANGEIEAAYHEWAAAMHKVDRDAVWPNANVQIGLDYMFSDENMKSWDRTTISAGFVNDGLLLPNKAHRSAQISLADAQAAGERFAAKKFDVQRQVLTAWADYVLANERARIQQENVTLLRLAFDTAQARLATGGSQQEIFNTEIELRQAEDELAGTRAEAAQMRAMLNAMMGRDATAELTAPMQHEPRPIAADDARLIASAVDRNPSLAELARQVEGRQHAVELARMMYLPDVSPQAALTGDVSQMIGAMVMLPTNVPAIRAEVKQMRSMQSASEAMLRQARLDSSGQFVAALVALRNYERQAALYEQSIIPAAQRVMELTRQSYAAASAGLVELIESRRMLLDVKLMLAEARAGRERRLAELEALAGVDVEVVGH